MRKTAKQETVIRQAWNTGFVQGARALAEVVADVVSMQQFYEIVERWEQLQRKLERERQAS